ncbi:hypothetical protein VP01_1991g1 [Puccinia sorghi]|uniref:Uncharacterized protein n=1 Tax=Puccinia sorghi TaxID=27349 RepID=A0A0L6VBQ2_9BASI|nr:hypothetical protein VP01_1991g1 [Puccinia sorghi]
MKVKSRLNHCVSVCFALPILVWMNDRDNDPLKIELPDSEYESAGEDPVKTSDSDNSSIERFIPEILKRKPTNMASPLDEIKIHFANSLQEMKNQFSEQLRLQNEQLQSQNAELISLRSRANNTTFTSTPRSHAENIMKQFIKSPIGMFHDENPKKPVLAFDGSNYSEWEMAIDRTITHAFDRDSSFIDNLLNFDTLSRQEDRAVASLLRNSLDPALLTIVETGKNISAKKLFETLGEKCKRSGRRHKLIAIEKMLRLAHDRPVASESWLATWCTLRSARPMAPTSRLAPFHLMSKCQ